MVGDSRSLAVRHQQNGHAPPSSWITCISEQLWLRTSCGHCLTPLGFAAGPFARGAAKPNPGHGPQQATPHCTELELLPSLSPCLLAIPSCPCPDLQGTATVHRARCVSYGDIVAIKRVGLNDLDDEDLQVGRGGVRVYKVGVLCLEGGGTQGLVRCRPAGGRAWKSECAPSVDMQWRKGGGSPTMATRACG